MLNKVYLIGTIHLDLKGPERLEKLLNYYKPDVIVTEGPRAKPHKIIKPTKRGLQQFKRNYDCDRLKINPETYYTLKLTIGYELAICANYAKKHNVKLITVDNVPWMKKYLNRLEKKPSFDKTMNGVMEKYFNLSPEKLISLMNRHYQSRIDEKDLSAGFTKKREALWEEMIRKQNGVVMWVGGAGHLKHKQNNLYDRLSDLDVKRIPLIKADSL
jgi:hypothetical protein